MTIYYSEVNSKYHIDRDLWCVSRINTTGSMLKGHAAIVVEGMDRDGNKIVRQFDIQAIIVNEDGKDKIQASVGNYQGRIAEIREFTSYRSLPGSPPESWFATPDKVEKMMQSIRDQKRRIEEGEILRFQTAGAWRSKYLGGNAAHNCFTWTEQELSIAGLGSGQRTGDSIKAIPDSRARHCLIL